MLHFQTWKVILVSVIVAAGLLFALPNLFSPETVSRLPTWLPHKQVNLGLDLQGGAHLLYQLDEKEMVEDWLKNIRADVRETLRGNRIGYTDLAQNVATRTVTVRIREPGDVEKAFEALKKLAVPVGADVFGGFSGNDLEVARQDSDGVSIKITDPGLSHRMSSAIQASIETIRRRVDAFGTTEPSIQREGRSRVLVQVPGVQDVERLKGLIGETGKLEFKLLDPAADPAAAAATNKVPPGDELVYSNENPPIPYVLKEQVLVSGANLVDAQPGFDFANRRAGRDLPLRRRGRQALRQGDPGERGATVRYRARRQGDLGARDPRADPRRHRPDQRQFQRAGGKRPGGAAPLRRSAGQAQRHRGAHRGREPRRRLRSRRAQGPPIGAWRSSCSLCLLPTACSACSPISRC